MTTFEWLQAHIDDCADASLSPEVHDQQLTELRELAALIIAGEV